MKAYIVVFTISIILTIASFFPFVFWLLLFAHDLNSVKYYSDDDNYDTFNVTVREFSVSEYGVYITFDHFEEDYYLYFCIRGENADIAVSNGLLDVLQQGEVFTITTASAYLGDGWDYPIAQLEHNGKILLPYEEGKQNIVEIQQVAENKAIKFFVILISIVGVLVVTDIVCIVGMLKGARKRKNPLNDFSLLNVNCYNCYFCYMR